MEQNPTQWKNVHICPNCKSHIELSELDLRSVTTGIAHCSKCEWSGRIEIAVVRADEFSG